jgi:hypothetical protein
MVTRHDPQISPIFRHYCLLLSFNFRQYGDAHCGHLPICLAFGGGGYGYFPACDVAPDQFASHQA